MNAKILEILAAQASCGGRVGMAEMLARLQAGTGAGAGIDSKEILDRLASTNPVIGSLLKQMSAQQTDPQAGGEANVIDVEAVEPQPALGDGSQDNSVNAGDLKLAELEHRAHRMAAELKVMRDRNDALAAALGACCLCWGQDLGCRSCRGRGGPGFCIPDEELFEEYVVPAVHTFRAQSAKVRAFTPAAPRNVEADSHLRSAAS